MPTSVEHWRVSIGCFHPKCIHKPIVTGEQGSDVVLALMYILLMHSVFHVKMAYSSACVCAKTLFLCCYVTSVVCCVYAWCVCCTCAYIALCVYCAYCIGHPVSIWKVGMLAYQVYSQLFLKGDGPSPHVHDMAVSAFTVYSDLVKNLLLYYRMAYGLYEYLLWILCCTIYKLCAYYLLLLNCVVFKIYCLWLFCQRKWTRDVYPVVCILSKHGPATKLGLYMYMSILLECNVIVFIRQTILEKLVECNGLVLHEVKAIPFVGNGNPLTVVACYVLGVSVHRVCSLAARECKVQCIVRCYTIIMMSYKLYLCFLLLCDGDVELNPGPISARIQRAKKKKYYEENKASISSQKKQYYVKNDDTIKFACKQAYVNNVMAKKDASKKIYLANCEAKKGASKKNYLANCEARKNASKKNYLANCEAKKDISKKNYLANCEARKNASKKNYLANCEAKKDASKKNYLANCEYKKAYSRQKYALNPWHKIATVKRYNARHRKEQLTYYRNRYALTEPRQLVHDQYNKKLFNTLLDNTRVTKELLQHYKQDLKIYRKRPSLLKKVACSVASKKLVNAALAKRKEHAGTLLGVVRSVKNIGQIKGEDDFGDKRHCASSEPYFYDAAYRTLNTHLPIPVTENGKCIVSPLFILKGQGAIVVGVLFQV